MIERKYTVVKQDGTPVDDCFVLKAGDVLAVSALRSYANNLLTVVEVDKMSGYNLMSPDMAVDYLRLADEVMDLADSWERKNHSKLPD